MVSMFEKILKDFKSYKMFSMGTVGGLSGNNDASWLVQQIRISYIYIRCF